MTDRTPARPASGSADVPGFRTLAGATSGPAEQRLVAWCLAALLACGGALGSVNLLVDGVLRDGAPRVVYAASMALLLLLSVVVAVRGRGGPRMAGALVVVGDSTYVVVAHTTTDTMLYAPPLMLLFCCAAAAWFLGPRMLAVHMALVLVACIAALDHTQPDAAALVVPMLMSATALDLVTLGLFLLRRRVERLLTHTQALSSTDPLTGLANRRRLVEQAPRLWRQARRDGQRIAALVLDLDHFKLVNDVHGHAVGDEVLQNVADTLAAAVRPNDVLARTGGEEMVVLGLVSDADDARHLAERLRLAVAADRPGDPPVTASIGVALVKPGDTELAADGLWYLIDRADVAMYEAKQAGRDRVVIAGAAPVRHPVDSGVDSL